jgi:hypothetical protein
MGIEAAAVGTPSAPSLSYDKPATPQSAIASVSTQAKTMPLAGAHVCQRMVSYTVHLPKRQCITKAQITERSHVKDGGDELVVTSSVVSEWTALTLLRIVLASLEFRSPTCVHAGGATTGAL